MTHQQEIDALVDYISKGDEHYMKMLDHAMFYRKLCADKDALLEQANENFKKQTETIETYKRFVDRLLKTKRHLSV